MDELLPIASGNMQKWLEIPKHCATDMADVVFDTGIVACSWFEKLDPVRFSIVSATCDLTKAKEILGHGSNLTHVLAIPGRVLNVFKAENGLEMTQALLGFIRSTSSVAAFLCDSAVIVSPKGGCIAGKIKYTTWSLSGAITVGEKLYALYNPTEEQEKYGKIISTLDLVKSIAFLSLGLLRLFNHSKLKRCILPTSTLLLLLVSVVYLSKKILDACDANSKNTPK